MSEAFGAGGILTEQSSRKVRVAILSDFHAYTASSTEPPRSHLSQPGMQYSLDPMKALHNLISTDNSRFTVDYLLCPGDLCDRGDSSALSWVWNELQKIADNMKAKRLFAVVGNHDVDTRLQGENTVKPEDMLKSLSPKFPFPQLDANSETYLSNGFEIVIEEDVRFLLMNTCQFHWNKNEQAHGKIGSKMLSDISSALKANKGFSGLNIALLHHSPQIHDDHEIGSEDFVLDGSRFLAALEEDQAGRWLVIHGHKHHHKISYSTGGSGSPVVFSAGSFSAFIEAKQSSVIKNAFHLLTIFIDDRSGLLSGTCETYEYRLGSGWVRPTDFSILAFESGFGFRGSLYELAAKIESEYKKANRSTLKFEALVDLIPQIRLLTHGDLKALKSILKIKHNLCLAVDDQARIFVYPGD